MGKALFVTDGNNITIRALTLTRARAHEGNRGLIEEEKFGPTSGRHEIPLAAFEFPEADKPAFTCPPAPYRPGDGVVDDAAVPCEEAAVGDGDDVPKRRNTVFARACCCGLSAAPCTCPMVRVPNLLRVSPTTNCAPDWKCCECGRIDSGEYAQWLREQDDGQRGAETSRFGIAKAA
jgi:hypothetical protein